MPLMIREYETKDEDQLKQLLSLCSEDIDLLNIINNSKFGFAYVALIKEKLVGLAFAWTSDWHPDCMYFRILSNPFYYGSDIEAKLLSLAETFNENHLPLQTSTWETCYHLNVFYRKSGFEEIRRTYTPTLIVEDNLDYLPIDKTSEGLITLTAMLADESLMEKLVTLVKRNYENTHQANPVKEMRPNEWRKLILADDLIADGSYVYLDQSQKNIVAYSFLHESGEEDSVELGWCGAIDAENRRLIPQLVSQQISYAMKHQIQFLIGEFDTTDDDAMEVLRSFPFKPSLAWVTYRRKPMIYF